MNLIGIKMLNYTLLFIVYENALIHLIEALHGSSKLENRQDRSSCSVATNFDDWSVKEKQF